MEDIIGRKQEVRLLNDYFQSKEAEFVVVFGRRRVGKTFLIKNVLSQHFAFYVTGLSPLEKKRTSEVVAQLNNFGAALQHYGLEGTAMPTSWMQAFEMLRTLLESRPANERQVVFIDEMSWLDSPRSGFLTAFEAFWNGWASGQSNLMLVACGSATTWIVKNLVSNHGGLYGRVTHHIALAPFTLGECEQYAISRGIKMSRYDILSAYMILGGIPYYWRQLQPRLSLAKNIDILFFSSKQARMRLEFNMLFASLFKKPEPYLDVVFALSKKNNGITRDEIAKCVKTQSGGTLTRMLSELELSSFITVYHPLKNRGAAIYKLTDFFTLFFLRYIHSGENTDPAYWSHTLNTPRHNTWAGISFENVCHLHLEQIKKALQIGGVLCNYQSLITQAAQVDLLLNRGDHVTNLCEIKFSSTIYSVTKKYEQELLKKISVVKECIPERNAVHLTMITTYGVEQNAHSSIIQNEVTMNDLYD